MGVPKRRVSTYRKGKRRATQKVVLPVFSVCQKCGSLVVAHQSCRACNTPPSKSKSKAEK